MKTITVRNIDDRLGKALRERARDRGVSLNKAVLSLLRQSLGIEKQGLRERKCDLDHLAGTWNETDLREFNEATLDTREIDQELWQ